MLTHTETLARLSQLMSERCVLPAGAWWCDENDVNKVQSLLSKIPTTDSWEMLGVPKMF